MTKLARFMSLTLLLSLIVAMVPATAPAEACGCSGCGPGTGTPGYWKNHPDAWPVDTIEIGGEAYSKEQAIAIMNMAVKQDKTITMFKALVAAKLNVRIGNCDCCILGTIEEADQWLRDFPVLSDVRANTEAWQYSHGEALYWALDKYNNGYLCAPPR